MKLPRDVDGTALVRALRQFGYEVTRQRGSHICLTTQLDGENHEVIPAHRPIKVGTLAGILKRIAAHHNVSPEALLKKLDL
jgi:predicted RNA binding protein YcfA (HicA-like mRNA interferase family)